MSAQAGHNHLTRDVKPAGQCPACDAWQQARFVDVFDEESLPPAQYLMMEVLAARHRLGETHWTFPSRHASIARELEGKGLVEWKSGITERTIRVWLTQAGKDCCLSPSYTAPASAS